jgi:polyisoprenoid-binding protein YceI
MTSSRALIVGLVVLVAIGIGGYVVYDQVLRGDSAPALALPSAVPGAAASPGVAASNDAGTSNASSGPVASASAATLDGDVNGTWTVTTGSQAGYRVREQLANLPAESDAVGRTDQVSGSITVTSDGTTATVTDGTLTVDTTSITSDESRRDNRMRSDGLQTDQFPTATFTLTQPVDVPAAAVQGTPADITLVGDLTLHGVTKSVSIPAKAQLVDGQIQVAGSVEITLADFAIVAPNVGGFIISIADNGALEFVLVLDKG